MNHPLSFDVGLIDIHTRVWSEWIIRIDEIEDEQQTYHSGETICSIREGGELILNTSFSNGYEIAMSVDGTDWRPKYEA